jgi:hypothetical protein
MKAEENKKKVELNDEELNDVAGGGQYGHNGQTTHKDGRIDPFN